MRRAPVPALKLLLISSGLVLTNHQVLRRLEHYLDSGSWFPMVVFCAIWLSGLGAIFYVGFTARRSARIGWTVLIVSSAFIGELYYLVSEDRLTVHALDAMWDPNLAGLDIPLFYGEVVLKAALKATPLLIGLLIPPPASGRSSRSSTSGIWKQRKWALSNVSNCSRPCSGSSAEK